MKELIKRIITGGILGFLFFFALVYLPPIYFSLILISILLQIIIFEWKNIFSIHRLTFWLLMPFYLIAPFTLLILLNHNPVYHNLLIILFIMVSGFDTGSYFFGNLVGSRKIVPWISPGKTWEGVLGGYLFAFIGLKLVFWELGICISFLTTFIFTTFVCGLSLSGDLFESWLKRRALVKDSGSILPGHGGFLDRFDGILFTAVFFYLFKNYLVNLFGF